LLVGSTPADIAGVVEIPAVPYGLLQGSRPPSLHAAPLSIVPIIAGARWPDKLKLSGFLHATAERV
jgi:hypothetical protein